MDAVALPSYEELYYSLWELSCRFSDFVNFRVIGCSHDKRYIPMLEIGTGSSGFYCAGGLQSRDYKISALMPQILQIYCQAFEEGWEIGHFYQTRKLLSKTRLWMIPLLNPDGYEICRCGYTAVRNPAFRQMLRTEFSHTSADYEGNARGNQIESLFLDHTEKELFLENENRTMISLIRELKGTGLLHLTTQMDSPYTAIWFCKKRLAPVFHHRSRHLVSCLLQSMEEGKKLHTRKSGQFFPEGTLENYYSQMTQNPSVQMRLPADSDLSVGEISKYPLECLYSITM